MSATLTLLLLVWAAAKYSVLCNVETVFCTLKKCAYPGIVLAIMLSTELANGCSLSLSAFAAFVGLSMLPLVPAANYCAASGFAAVAVMSARLFASGCILRGAASITFALVVLAVQ